MSRQVSVDNARSLHAACRETQRILHDHNLTDSDACCVKFGDFLHGAKPLHLPRGLSRGQRVHYVTESCTTNMCDVGQDIELDDCSQMQKMSWRTRRLSAMQINTPLIQQFEFAGRAHWPPALDGSWCRQSEPRPRTTREDVTGCSDKAGMQPWLLPSMGVGVWLARAGVTECAFHFVFVTGLGIPTFGHPPKFGATNCAFHSILWMDDGIPTFGWLHSVTFRPPAMPLEWRRQP